MDHLRGWKPFPIRLASPLRTELDAIDFDDQFFMEFDVQCVDFKTG